jgi:hypothetical protein
MLMHANDVITKFHLIEHETLVFASWHDNCSALNSVDQNHGETDRMRCSPQLSS